MYQDSYSLNKKGRLDEERGKGGGVLFFGVFLGGGGGVCWGGLWGKNTEGKGGEA